ncbi:Basic-leucine zipper [Gracilaria domingensis]|nr:Basic-leucine zipper [Gracilaria domingensis]
MSYLTNPNIRNISITCTSRETKIDPTSPIEASMSDSYGSSYFLTPAFTCNSITFGIGVENAIYFPAPAWNFPEACVNAVGECRFVKNDQEGYMIIVACYQTECVRIEYVKTLSPTSQIRCVIGTKLPLFRSATKGGSCNMDAVFPTLLLLHTSYETRDCPYCASEHSKCNCLLQIAKPRHPLDHASFVTNMSTRLGTFYGASHVSMYREGMGMCMGAVGTRFKSQQCADEDLIESLRNLVISRHALIQDPRSILTSSEDSSPSDMQMVDSAHAKGGQADPQQQQSVNQLVADPDSLSDDFNFDASKLLEVSSVPSELNTVLNTIELPHEAGHIQDVSQMNRLVPVADNGTVVGSSEKSSSETGNADGQQALPNGRDSATDETTQSQVVSPGSRDNDSVIRRLKAELRREKNRAAAQRSNMRKKALNDTLKHNLKTVREKVDLLRSKEMLLREENLRLRELLEE